MSSNSWETELNSECSSDRPDTDKVRQLCREHGVPAELRGKIWQVCVSFVPALHRHEDLLCDNYLFFFFLLRSQILLGVCNKNANLDVWSESDLDLEDQQVIKADVIRTRQNLPLFKSEQVSAYFYLR
jgi:hypothetical protein